MIQCFSIEFIAQFMEACILSAIYKLRISNSPQVCQNIRQIFQMYFCFNLVGLVFILFFWKQPKVKQQKEEIQIMLVETKNIDQEEEQ
ncbi:unnamed protein product [Paramecium octaurelia]|uniref:Transmembrane protein n=1 Tax=Paramecium octaurelia TaxID=43137 RepID=A0A8S1SUS3_PAROT|nr:unnamed protein product [Paramecium octaurelia]